MRHLRCFSITLVIIGRGVPSHLCRHSIGDNTIRDIPNHDRADADYGTGAYTGSILDG